MIKQKVIFLPILFGFSLGFGADGIFQKDKIEQLKIGNLALPTSQQPGPLLGFGQNIVDKGDLQAYLYVDYLHGFRKSWTEIWPTILYGIKDNLSLFVQLPITLKFKLNNQVSRSVEDLLVQFEYAVYEKNKETSTNQVTFVANMTLPTGSANDQLPSSFGAPSYFLGLTASHMGDNWYPFVSTGAIITTSNNDTKFGNQFLYECGVCKNISYVANKWILSGMVEMHGLYIQRSTIAGTIDPNSGWNDILVGPSLWFSTQRFVGQAGIAWSVYHKLFGNQINKHNYYVTADIGWKF